VLGEHPFDRGGVSDFVSTIEEGEARSINEVLAEAKSIRTLGREYMMREQHMIGEKRADDRGPRGIIGGTTCYGQRDANVTFL
jgi:hypothetical protein